MTDTHIGLAIIFDVPEGQDAATHKANFYAKSKKGTKELIYYGFASLGNKVNKCKIVFKHVNVFSPRLGDVSRGIQECAGLPGSRHGGQGWSWGYHQAGWERESQGMLTLHMLDTATCIECTYFIFINSGLLRLSVAALLVNWKKSNLTWMVVFLLRWGNIRINFYVGEVFGPIFVSQFI